MSRRVYRWPVSLVALLIVSMLPQAGARAYSGELQPASRATNRIGANFRISGDHAASDEGAPVVAHNPTNGQYLVVWADDRNHATRGWDIYGQRIKADGSLVGKAFRISGDHATSDEGPPAVAYNSVKNQYLVVWEDHRNEATRGTDIYGQRIKADGSPVGGNFRISSEAATSIEWSPAVAYNSVENQYLVVWEDLRNPDTRGWDIYGQRVEAGGRRVGGNFRISSEAATSSENLSAVAYNPVRNQYLVVWKDTRNDDTRGSDIYGQRVKAGGRRVGGNFRISGASATSHEWSSAVAYDPVENQYLVVWADDRNHATRGWDIYGQRVKAGGIPVGGNIRISGASATSHDSRPAVAYNSAKNQYLVAWEDRRNGDARGYDIYGQRVKAGGEPAGGNFRISGKDATSDEMFAAVACNSAKNQYLVVWQDWRNETTRELDVYGQRIAG